MSHTIRLPWALATTLTACLLAACGGGGDDSSSNSTASADSAAASKLTLASASPSANNSTIDLSTATTKGNNTRAADAFSSQPYCEAFWENATASNGKKYAVQVYFRQSDKAPLNVSVFEASTGWAIFQNDSGRALTGLSVDTATRTISFNNKVLAGNATEAGTLSGAVNFPANASTPACGS